MCPDLPGLGGISLVYNDSDTPLSTFEAYEVSWPPVYRSQHASSRNVQRNKSKGMIVGKPEAASHVLGTVTSKTAGRPFKLTSATW